MKRFKNLYLTMFFLITIGLIFGFTLSSNDIHIENVVARIDSLMHRGNMTGNGTAGRGMMNGRMMGSGMMGMAGGMMNGSTMRMGRGMTGQSNTTKDNNGRWIAPPSAGNLKNPLNDIARASRLGKSIFDSQCFTCHGTDAKGDGPAAAALNPKPADLTSRTVQDQSDGAIFWKISNGNSPMPSFKYSLSANQRWELVDYIRQLGK